MCVIAVAVKSEIDLASLYKCEAANPHGGGVAWAEKGYVHFKKGIKAEEMQDLVKDKPFPHVYHFRIASVGKIIPALCHPFVVRRKQNCDMEGVTSHPVLFHNGTVTNWRFLAKVAGVTYPEFASDSMIIARIISLRGEALLSQICDHSRFCVLHPDGKVNLHGGFAELNGNRYSNMHSTLR